MLQETYPLWVGSRPEEPNHDLEVLDKYSGEVATRVPKADVETIERAIAASVRAREACASMPAYARQAVLMHCAQRFQERFDELALALCIEAGKPIQHSRGEVTRLIDTFRLAAEESVRIVGEVMPLDVSPRAKGYRGQWKRVPIGPCSFIAPWNFPLNLVAHKVAPALAVGCPFVLKPASATPVGALLIGEILAETDLPEGAFSILPCGREAAEPFTTDERLKLLSFTGSPEVGFDLKARAGKKQVVLELGGNAAVVVDETWDDLDDAVERIVFGAFYQSGQSCIGVQRIFLQEEIYDEMKERLVERTKRLKAGNPREESTFVGPIISEKEATRLESWIRSAEEKGGTLLCGGRREGNLLEATLLENVSREQDLVCNEAFGPVAVISSFKGFEAALAEVNDSKFGLQAGIFTRDLYRAERAWDVLEVGGVLIGEVPSWRVDHMPYGGVKESGIGREGIRWAIEDMTEVRLLVIRTPAATR